MLKQKKSAEKTKYLKLKIYMIEYFRLLNIA